MTDKIESRKEEYLIGEEIKEMIDFLIERHALDVESLEEIASNLEWRLKPYGSTRQEVIEIYKDILNKNCSCVNCKYASPDGKHFECSKKKILMRDFIMGGCFCREWEEKI